MPDNGPTRNPEPKVPARLFDQTESPNPHGKTPADYYQENFATKVEEAIEEPKETETDPAPATKDASAPKSKP